ncbi:MULTISPECIES: LysR family transcriptional regulator [Virgibacillus]|uniref:HTH-type transcriptional regulator GltC n=1 Tax=Virgibacillus dokdonensis TaxID=302167 RepID=A0A2K9J1L8_9BACI|nr:MULTISPECIES: LysR family transcriptional regulator [Virgibacillus]AUJ25614.1 HTH-type transcriptional regulator GltC [Virgibacillus dokdonensis]NWO12171.1 LysR family transcriptional regulator [Virgibacillus sp.]
MELRQIRYFMEVASREHVTEAATALHVAQSSVSRQIANLESELGADLFIRENRKIKLTPIGKIFFERMKQAMNVIDHASREVEEYVDPKKGTIRVAYPISLAAYMLPTVIHAFRTEYPEAKFNLKQALYPELMHGLTDGDFNLALLGPLPKENNKFQRKALFTERIVALLPLHHPLADRSSIRLRELKDDPFIVLPEGFVLRNLVEEACYTKGFAPIIGFEGDDTDALKGLVSAGLGIALMPEVTLIDNTPRSTVAIPLAENDITRTVGVITPSHRQLLPTEAIFYDFLLQFFSRINYFSH